MTPGYSPPEQYGTARTDPRTDIYSLGATLYAALSGIIPEDGLARAMDNTQLTPLRKRNSKVSRRLASAIEKAMGIDPADRFQNADDFKKALLGAKTKTQLLPGDFMIEPPPVDAMDELQQNSLEKASKPPLDYKGNGKEAVRAEELPVFKPRRKRRKGRRVLVNLLLILLLLSVAIVGFVRFLPQLVPPMLVPYVGPLMNFPLPVIPGFGSPNTPAPIPTRRARVRARRRTRPRARPRTRR